MIDQENKLIQKIVKNNRVAQKQLYYSYVKLIGSIAHRYLKDETEVKDIIQNTFIKVFQNIKQYDSKKGQFKSWISRIAINESIAILRAKKRLKFASLDNTLEIEDNSYENKILSKLELEEVSVIIDNLPDEEKVILDLFYYEQYSHLEISKLLYISVESSRVKLYRAKKSFFQKWKEISGNEIRRII